jgi:hypothetical protein
VLELQRVGASRVRVSRLCTVFTASAAWCFCLVVQYSGELGPREANGDPGCRSGLSHAPFCGVRRGQLHG